jgi:hypothetical protein
VDTVRTGRLPRPVPGRNHWVPLPEAADLDALNTQLLAGCRADEHRVIQGRTQSVGEAMTIEHASLRP